MATTHTQRLVGALAALALIGGIAACGDDDATSSSSSTAEEAGRAAATITLSDGAIDVPAELPGGLVDVTLRAEEGEQSHHLVFARLNDGVTYDQLDAAGDSAFDTLVTLRGGNGSLAPGDEMLLVLDLPAGDYQILDLPNGEVAAAARTTVGEATGDATEPTASSTVTLGPDMTIHLPSGFDGTGLVQFTNADPELPHEATLFALAPGSTPADVVAWATTFEGPPPGDLVGGFGAIGSGLHGWADLGSSLPKGDYALVCLLPGADGGAHAASGMVSGFTVA